MQIGPAQLLLGNILAGGDLDQGRSAGGQHGRALDHDDELHHRRQ